MNKKFAQFTLKNIIDLGKHIMTPLELKDYIDFEVKRVYFITQPKGKTGAHCHKIEEELFILIQGKCVASIDKGNGLEEIPMEGPKTAIYLPAYVWHSFKDLTPDAVLLALSSTNYSAKRDDYIEDYEEFKKVRSQLCA